MAAGHALTVEELAARAPRWGLERFRREFGQFVLVGAPPIDDLLGDEEGDPMTPRWSYVTSTLDRSELPSRTALPLSHHVYGVRKARRGAFADTVLVGRASSNDVVIDDNSVSKLHARIHLDDKLVTMSDAGSTNGTTLNGKTLTKGQRVPLRHGDDVAFGQQTYQVKDSERFYQELVAARGPEMPDDGH